MTVPITGTVLITGALPPWRWPIVIFTFASGTASTAPFLAASAVGAVARAAAREMSGIRRLMGSDILPDRSAVRPYWASSATVLLSM